MNKLYVEIGEHLREKRKSLGFTQAKMAEHLGISENYYGDIERGKRALPVSLLKVLSDKFGADASYIINGTPSDHAISSLVEDCPKDKRYDLEQMLRYASNLYRNERK